MASRNSRSASDMLNPALVARASCAAWMPAWSAADGGSTERPNEIDGVDGGGAPPSCRACFLARFFFFFFFFFLRLREEELEELDELEDEEWCPG